MNDIVTSEKLTAKDFTSDQEVRWCPGCGDYAIVKGVRASLANMGVKRENTVFVSGIGCAARFPYYLSTYGFHTIHGRAAAIATGVKLAESGTRRLGGFWRWRRSLDRRQPYAPPIATERRSSSLAV